MPGLGPRGVPKISSLSKYLLQSVPLHPKPMIQWDYMADCQEIPRSLESHENSHFI